MFNLHLHILHYKIALLVQITLDFIVDDDLAQNVSSPVTNWVSSFQIQGVEVFNVSRSSFIPPVATLLLCHTWYHLLSPNNRNSTFTLINLSEVQPGKRRHEKHHASSSTALPSVQCSDNSLVFFGRKGGGEHALCTHQSQTACDWGYSATVAKYVKISGKWLCEGALCEGAGCQDHLQV